MPATRRRFIWGVILCLSAVGLARAVSGHHDLLTKAKRIELTHRVIANEYTFSGYHYHYHHVPSYGWLSDAELISIQETNRGRYETIRFDLNHGTIFRRSGRGADTGDRTFSWVIAPAGSWILYTSSADQDAIYTVRNFDGARQYSWTNRFEDGPDPTWLGDGSGFVEWSSAGGPVWARLHLLATGQISQFRLDQIPEISTKDVAKFGGRNVALPGSLRSSDAVAEFLEFVGEAGGITASRHAVRLPDQLKPGAAKAFRSPRGDRLAWLVTYEHQVPELTLSREFPFIGMRPRRSLSLFVSNLDGKGLRWIGGFRRNDEIGEVQWTPDSGRLSFLCDSAVWTVPAE